MSSEGTLDKYSRFTADYNAGMSEAALCSNYGMPPEKLESFYMFLQRKGYELKRTVTPVDDDGAMDRGTPTVAHEVDYEIFGDDMQFVEVELDPGETAVAEAGAMMYMDDGIELETIFGDGSKQSEGVMSKIFGAGKRVLTGESLFMTAFTNRRTGKRKVAFAASIPGKIIPVDLKLCGGELICQKDAFLCAAKGVEIGIALQKKIGAGLFGGEGFILQRLKGDGEVFVHAGGTIIERQLSVGEKLKVDTGCLMMMHPTVRYDIEYVGSVKTALFGGEGFFYATLTGPGRVWLQSLPFARLRSKITQGLQSSGSGGGFNIKLGG
jgi:uncharacterized protein (TIGR00266 family)